MGMAAQSFWQLLQRTSSPSTIHMQQTRATGISRGRHHLQLYPADTVMGMAAQSFRQQLQRTSSSSGIRKQQATGAINCRGLRRHRLLAARPPAASSKDYILFNHLQAMVLWRQSWELDRLMQQIPAARHQQVLQTLAQVVIVVWQGNQCN